MRNVQTKKVGLRLNGTHDTLVYADVNLSGGNKYHKENTEIRLMLVRELV
jgi:hypothetical protein